MGGLVSIFSDWVYGNQEASILILGLDAAYKERRDKNNGESIFYNNKESYYNPL